MKRPDNTEMDRLLRRHARLGGGAVLGAHMDADEMNAYAEGALPEAARSRYFAHLADCDSCRKLVTELTLAATASAEGRERAAAAVTAAPSKSWRERLAALFSPQVLRFAVPALALFAVVIVAIVAMRANRDASSVARNEQNTARPAPASGTATDANSAVPQAPAGVIENHAADNASASPTDDRRAEEKTEATASAGAPAPAEKAPADKEGVLAAQPTPASTTTAQSEDAKAASREMDQPVGGKRAQEEVQVAQAPPPPRPAQEPVLAAPAAAGETSMRDEQEQRKQKDAGKDDGEDISTGTVSKKAESNRERRDAGRAEGAAAPATRSKAPMARRVGPGAATAQTESAAATRSVGGRNFQRQGGAWVDTAYNSSRPTTDVRRGSEQFRTLVADEPGLRAITDQLGGEVIVVWKNRAYRFN